MCIYLRLVHSGTDNWSRRLKTIKRDDSRFVHVRKRTYRIYFLDMSKGKVKILMINSDLIDKNFINGNQWKILWWEWEWEWEWKCH